MSKQQVGLLRDPSSTRERLQRRIQSERAQLSRLQLEAVESRNLGISVVVLQPQVRDQLLALQMPQRILQLHQLDE